MSWQDKRFDADNVRIYGICWIETIWACKIISRLWKKKYFFHKLCCFLFIMVEKTRKRAFSAARGLRLSHIHIMWITLLLVIVTISPQWFVYVIHHFQRIWKKQFFGLFSKRTNKGSIIRFWRIENTVFNFYWIFQLVDNKRRMNEDEKDKQKRIVSEIRWLNFQKKKKYDSVLCRTNMRNIFNTRSKCEYVSVTRN